MSNGKREEAESVLHSMHDSDSSNRLPFRNIRPYATTWEGVLFWDNVAGSVWMLQHEMGTREKSCQPRSAIGHLGSPLGNARTYY